MEVWAMTAETATKPDASPAVKPVTTLTVPARPALVTGANLLALASTAAATAGPAGVAVLGAVAAATGAGAVVRRRRASRLGMAGMPAAGRMPGGRGLGGRLRGGRRKSAGAGAGAGAGKAAGAGRRGLGLGGKAAGRAGSTSGKAGGAGRLGGRLSGLGGGKTATGRVGKPLSGLGRPTAGGGGGRGRMGGLRGLGGGKGGGLGRMAAAGRRAVGLGRGLGAGGGSSRRASGSRVGVGRLRGAARVSRSGARFAVKAGKHAAWGAGKTARRAARVAFANLKVRSAWTALALFVRRHLLGIKPPTPAGGDQDGRETGDQVRRPETTDRTNSSKELVIMGNTTPTGGSSAFFQACRQAHAIAAQTVPKGMLEVREEAYELPFSLAEIASALRVRAHACAKEPLEKEFASALMQISTLLGVVADASRRLGPAFDDLHARELKRLLNPRPNEHKWDRAANGL